MANSEDEFVPKSVKDNIVLRLSDYSKHENYIHNLDQNNLKNDMHTAILRYNKLQSDFLGGCVFNNNDEKHYHPVFNLLSVVNKLANDNTMKTEHLIVYSANVHLTYLND